MLPVLEMLLCTRCFFTRNAVPEISLGWKLTAIYKAGVRRGIEIFPTTDKMQQRSRKSQKIHQMREMDRAQKPENKMVSPKGYHEQVPIELQNNS